MADLCAQLRTMPSSLNDACRTMETAADQIETLLRALASIANIADNLQAEVARGAIHAAVSGAGEKSNG